MENLESQSVVPNSPESNPSKGALDHEPTVDEALSFIEERLGFEVPKISMSEKELDSESPYHNYKTSGYLYKGPKRHGENKASREVLSDACVIAASETEIYDPEFLVGDIWGSIYVFDKEGNRVAKLERTENSGYLDAEKKIVGTDVSYTWLMGIGEYYDKEGNPNYPEYIEVARIEY